MSTRDDSPRSDTQHVEGSSDSSLTGTTSSALPVESLPPPSPRSESQLKQEIEEWRQDYERRTLVLKPVSRVTFRALRLIWSEYRPCRFYRSIKALYIFQLEYLELRKTSTLEYNASCEIGQMFLYALAEIGFRGLITARANHWSKFLFLDGAGVFACPEGDSELEGGNEETEDESFTYMEADSSFTPRNLMPKTFRSIYDTVLPTLVILVGIDSEDEKIVHNLEKWFRRRKALSSEVNALINISIKIESNTCLSFELLVFGRPAHSIPDVPLISPHLAFDSPYHLYAQLQWKHEWDITPDIPSSLSFSPSILWGIGNCPENFPVDERIIFSKKELVRFSETQLVSLRNSVYARDRWPDTDT